MQFYANNEAINELRDEGGNNKYLSCFVIIACVQNALTAVSRLG